MYLTLGNVVGSSEGDLEIIITVKRYRFSAGLNLQFQQSMRCAMHIPDQLVRHVFGTVGIFGGVLWCGGRGGGWRGGAVFFGR